VVLLPGGERLRRGVWLAMHPLFALGIPWTRLTSSSSFMACTLVLPSPFPPPSPLLFAACSNLPLAHHRYPSPPPPPSLAPINLLTATPAPPPPFPPNPLAGRGPAAPQRGPQGLLPAAAAGRVPPGRQPRLPGPAGGLQGRGGGGHAGAGYKLQPAGAFWGGGGGLGGRRGRRRWRQWAGSSS
jgi:uncharacterized membrane protein YgcG